MIILFAIIATSLAILTIYFLDRIKPIKLEDYRYTSLDGLRGFLSFFVFLHHSFIWYLFIHTKEWVAPPSNLYRFFGTGSVMIFFMITSFLFFGRLLDAKSKKTNIDWLRLYTSRILRIGPLFLFAVFVSFLVSGYVNSWDFKDSFLLRFFATLGLGIFQAPILNWFTSHGVGGPVMAEVLWTLPYEWIFYFSLPFFAILLKLRVSKVFFILPFLAVVFSVKLDVSYIAAIPFVSGIVAAIFVRLDFIKDFASGNFASCLILALLIVLVSKINSPFHFYSQVVLGVFFYTIACGNSFFGILNSRVSRLFGEISYSLYLLHGVLLFFTLRVILGDQTIVLLSLPEYLLYVLLLVPVLVTLCFFTFLTIEKPFMHFTPTLSKYLEKKQACYVSNASDL